MPSLLPTPEPADPVEGQPGHFEHSNWLKASVKALDAGVVHKAEGIPVAVATGTLIIESGTVTFPPGRFTAPPIVVATAESVNPVIVVVAGVSSDAFTVRCFSAGGSPISDGVNWIAVQM